MRTEYLRKNVFRTLYFQKKGEKTLKEDIVLAKCNVNKESGWLIFFTIADFAKKLKWFQLCSGKQERKNVRHTVHMHGSILHKLFAKIVGGNGPEDAIKAILTLALKFSIISWKFQTWDCYVRTIY